MTGYSSARYGLASLVPATGLFPYYITQASRLTRCPPVYHIASLAAVIGAIAEPRTELLMGSGDLVRKERFFLWFLLIGPSANKKSYSTDLALAVADDLLSDRKRTGIGTRRELETELRDEPRPFIFIREAAAWFANNRQAMMADGSSFWTTAYDGWVQPKGAKEFPVGPTIVMAGPTIDVMRITRARDWMNGLLSRICLVAAGPIQRGPGGHAWPEPVKQRIAGKLSEIGEIASQAPFVHTTRQARLYHEKWDTKLGMFLSSKSDLHATACNRLAWQTFRLAGVYALSRSSTVVSLDDMKAACRFGEYIRDSVMSIDPSN